MVAFLVIGALGLAIVVLSLVLGEFLEGVFEGFDIDVDVDVDADGLFSTPVIGSFLAAFGFGAALVMYATNSGAGIAALGGVGSGVIMGGAALVITRAFMHMPTDRNVNTRDLVGKAGVVISPIPVGGFGEVTVRHAGQLLKLHARSEEALAAGTPVWVIAVTSPSSVFVKGDEYPML